MSKMTSSIQNEKGSVIVVALIILTLLNYRLIGKKQGKDVSWDAWHKKASPILRFLGPILIVISLFRIVFEINYKPYIPPFWEKYVLPDSSYSAEFPFPPRHEIKEETLPNGTKLVIKSYVLYIREYDLDLRLAMSPYYGNTESDEEINIQLKERLKIMGNLLDFKIDGKWKLIKVKIKNSNYIFESRMMVSKGMLIKYSAVYKIGFRRIEFVEKFLNSAKTAYFVPPLHH